MTISMKDKIRAATVGSKRVFKSKIVELEGVEIEIRQVDLSVRSQITRTAINAEDKSIDILGFQINSIIEYCYVPGTKDKVFDINDVEMLSGCVSGGYADVLWEAIQELQNMTVADAKKT